MIKSFHFVIISADIKIAFNPSLSASKIYLLFKKFSVPSGIITVQSPVLLFTTFLVYVSFILFLSPVSSVFVIYNRFNISSYSLCISIKTNLNKLSVFNPCMGTAVFLSRATSRIRSAYSFRARCFSAAMRTHPLYSRHMLISSPRFCAKYLLYYDSINCFGIKCPFSITNNL